MKRRLIAPLIVTALLVAAAGWITYRTIFAIPAEPAAPAPATQQVIQTVNGETVVQVAADAQRASHIETQPIAAKVIRPEQTAYAAVLDLQPLFDQHYRLATARADRDSLRAQAAASRAQYERSRVLFDDNHNISQRALQDAQAAARTDQAKLQAAEAAQRGLAAMLRQQYGDVLAAAATDTASPLFGRLLAGRSMIVRVVLSIDPATSAPDDIMIDSPDAKSIPAKRLSASPQSDPAIQGISYMYAADARLPSGTNAIAHIPSGAAGNAGLLIPESAVVWYGGEAWAYVRTAADRFTRRFVPSAAPIDQGFVVTSGFRAGDQVVIHGAQLLLSEELRPQGIATQCKDPPECDD